MKLPNSIFIESREWFDRSAGNSYFSNRVKVDGKFVYSSGIELGYETQYIHEALTELYKRGIISADLSTPYKLREAGVALYFVKYDSPKRDMFTDEEGEAN
jgi:hypothetical protein